MRSAITLLLIDKMNFRPARVSKEIRRELNTLLNKDVELDGALATITSVDVDRKLGTAEVNISILPHEKAEVSFEKLKERQGHLQFLLARRLEIKPMPHIVFKLDHGMEHAADIEKVLLKEDNKDTAR